MEYNTITFYKFINVPNSGELMGYVRGLCEALDLKGRVLIGNEGINAGVSGKSEDIENFKSKIKKHKLLRNLTFKEQEVPKNSYHRLVVRVRKEILAFKTKVDMKNIAKHINPETLNKWIERDEDLVILDARNDYEAEIGKFKNAIVLSIKNFYDFPKELENLEHLKDKKIVTYCTGGIRCEKATALMKEKGFKNVFQLKGGIINYVNQYPDENFDGDVFVFDDRLNTSTGSNKKLGKCQICKEPCNDYTDCHNLDCDKLFITCSPCKEKMNNTCSQECKNSKRMRPMIAKN